MITWTKYQARDEQKCSSVNQLRMAPAGLADFREQATHHQKPFWCAATMSQGLSTSWVVRCMQEAGTSSLHCGGSSLGGRGSVRYTPAARSVRVPDGQRSCPAPWRAATREQSCEHAVGDECDQTTCHLCPFLSLSLIPNGRVLGSAMSPVSSCVSCASAKWIAVCAVPRNV